MSKTNKKINLKRTIKSLRGEEREKSFPTQKEMDSLPKKDGKPDMTQLEKETVGNVIFNCLSFYQVKDKKDIFLVNISAQAVLDEGEVELKDKVRDFIIEVLKDSILMTETVNGKKEEVGIYRGWIIVQCLEELGVNNFDEK